MNDTLCVTTRDPLQDILAANNSAAWFLQPKRARMARYLVCAAMDSDDPSRNRRPFLIAEISNVVLDPEASAKRPRYAVCFQRYAALDVAQEKPLTGSQNPVRWGEHEKLITARLDRLAWKDVPSKSLPYSYSVREPRVAGLTIEEAKRGLAARFGVSEGAITITIQS
jgi:hypothetical protein